VENCPYNARILVIYIVQVQSVIELFGKQVNNALNVHKFSMYDWGKKRKMLVFTGVYVCVKAKLTFVSFFFNFFILHLSLNKQSIVCFDMYQVNTDNLVRHCRHSVSIEHVYQDIKYI